MLFLTFFNLSLNFAIRSQWSEPQLAPSLVFTDYIELLHLWLQRRNNSDFGIDHLLVFMYRVVCWIVGKGVCRDQHVLFLLFTLLHFVLEGQTCLLLQVSLDFLILHFQSPMMKRISFFLVLFLEDLIGIRRIIQLQLLQHQWLDHRLGLLWG